MSIQTSSPSILPPKFAVCEVDKENLCSIYKTVKEWSKTAQKRYKDASKLDSDQNKLLKLSTSDSIIKLMAACLNTALQGLESGDLPDWDTVLVCKDEKMKVQAVALILKNENKLVFLAANPNNCKSASAEQVQQPKWGAGTQIITYLAQLALKTGKPIQANSHFNAVGFYEKLGFEGSKSLKMTLTVPKISQLIADKIPPYDQ